MKARSLAVRCFLVAVTVAGLLLAHGPAARAQAPSPAVSIAWSDPTRIASGLRNAAEPALAFTPDRTAHAMWQADGFVYYASQRLGEPWSPGKRLASGTSPGLAVDAAGVLHAVFANSFQGNYEIYHMRMTATGWSFPIAVSRTSGPSMQPVLIADRKQGLHAAWMDYTSGTWTIYIGTWLGTFWSSYPVSNAVGKDPSLAALLDGTVSLAWQRQVITADDPVGTFDIFSSERQANGWSLPVNVSVRADNAPVDSTGVSTLAGPDGRVHLTWQEGEREVAYDFGRGMYWPRATVAGTAQSIARGPQLGMDQEGYLNIAWDEGEVIRVATAPAGTVNWPAAGTLRPPLGDQKDVTLSTTASNQLTIGWVQTDSDSVSAIYESRRALMRVDLDVKVHLPLILR